MYIATLLDPSIDQQTQAIWSLLERNCGLSGIRVTPIPHFSWQGAASYEPEEVVQQKLIRICEQIEPFDVHVTGLGLFTGESPVLFLPVIKNQTLLEVHQRLWDELLPFAAAMSPYYAPDSWQPHITLAYKDVNPGNLVCAVEDLAFRDLSATLRVNHLAMIYQSENEVGVKQRILFGPSQENAR
jgi:2'-5' RNA ligase